MIIKNNFNKKSVDSLNDYENIGKGSNSLDKKLQKEQEGFIRKNIDNPIIQNIINSDKEYEEDDSDDNKWSFFN